MAAGPAAANSAPPRWVGSKSGVLVPGTSAQVHVAKETLRFDLADTLETATVAATYQMENRGPALSQFPVVFVYQSVKSGAPTATVTWNGTPLATEPVDLSKQSAADAAQTGKAWSEMTTVIDPVTGEQYSNQDFFGQTSLQFVQFQLDLKAGEQGALEVKYNHVAASDKGRHANKLFHYQYLLLPAKGWASFGPVEIQVKAPGPDKAFFASTLPMQWQGDLYTTTLPGLPDQNLAFSFMSKAGLIGSMADPGPYYAMGFVLVLVAALLLGWGMGRLSGLIRSRGWALAVAIVAGVLLGGVIDFLAAFGILGLFPALADQAYGAAFTAIGIWLLAVPVTAVAAGVVAGRTQRRRAQVAPAALQQHG